MSELDKTIEELEAEVLAELEEAHGADSDAPKKGSLKSEPMQKVKKDFGLRFTLSKARSMFLSVAISFAS